ncbi:helix-turn-helix domain-containing protein [Microbacterium sp. KSW2-21]|uniref:Helix-turn-helix domain-containing protein n=1 Tax=Microbacterium algihabitans TaxID=3075992 RepID=A0ABU3RWG2_9MICO|nr:helix-turn-helix domain-containing protein [Microbacterium sp. KSW2-21]MDU0327226.1 helix-turn-helix domain-containing protein [Microbacterium sp. KSW2-21]
MTDDALDALFADAPDTLSPTDISKKLRVTTRTVYSWLKEGTIRGYQIGSTWFIMKADLIEHLRAGTNKSHGDSQPG